MCTRTKYHAYYYTPKAQVVDEYISGSATSIDSISTSVQDHTSSSTVVGRVSASIFYSEEASEVYYHEQKTK
jgi:hypothetical protein